LRANSDSGSSLTARAANSPSESSSAMYAAAQKVPLFFDFEKQDAVLVNKDFAAKRDLYWNSFLPTVGSAYQRAQGRALGTRTPTRSQMTPHISGTNTPVTQEGTSIYHETETESADEEPKVIPDIPWETPFENLNDHDFHQIKTELSVYYILNPPRRLYKKDPRHPNMSKGVPVANPTPFNGNRNNTDRFLAECKLVFMAKANDFLLNPSLTTSGTDDQKKILFVLSYMKNKTANSFKLAWLNDPANTAKSYTEFETKLKEAFKQYDKAQRTRLRLETLSQGRFTTDAYTSTFNEVAADSEFDDIAKAHFCKNGLNLEILCNIEMMDTVPTKPDDIQQKAITFGLKIDKVNLYRQPQGRTNNTGNYYRHPNARQRYPQRGTCDDPITVD
jgi:hypothetical protein